jgi:predicted nucleic acid-binding protein
MTFSELLNGDRVFIDANIFIYHFSGFSLECKALFDRIFRKELVAYTSTSVLAEILHRLMIAEAIDKGYISPNQPAKKLKKHPELIRKLSDYNRDVAKISTMNIEALNSTRLGLERSAHIRETEGLLTNDSLILATMKEMSLTKLATNDQDFERINWVDVYTPTDI